jgi:hypothetical protein
MAETGKASLKVPGIDQVTGGTVGEIPKINPSVQTYLEAFSEENKRAVRMSEDIAKEEKKRFGDRPLPGDPGWDQSYRFLS